VHADCKAIGNDGFKALAEGLASNEALLSINLSGCESLSDKGCRALGECLKSNRALTKIDLSGCHRILDNGCKAIGEGLTTNQALMSLDLSRCNRIGDDGCKALAEGLKSNKTLTSLDASCCGRIGDEGCKALAEVLKTNKALTSLKITGNFITTTCAEEFVKMVEVNPYLLDLQIGCPYQASVHHALKEKLKKNKLMKEFFFAFLRGDAVYLGGAPELFAPSSYLCAQSKFASHSTLLLGNAGGEIPLDIKEIIITYY